MADESRNPKDNYELRALQSELKGLGAEIRNELRRVDEALSRRETYQRRSAPERPAAAERGRGRAIGGRVSGGSPAEEAAQTRRLVGLEDDLNASRQRGVRASEQQLGLEKALARARDELRTRPVREGRPDIAQAPIARGGPAAAAGEAAALGRYQNDLRAAVAAGAPYDDSLRRHGALTTEFFDALKRGEVTFGEFRYQMGATIAKFSGWTAASILVFGALDAVRQFGKGALDASAGASQLQRYINDVDTSKAQSQFVDLAQQFNLPIADVADAMSRMGQVFHDQDQAFEATKAALYGVKVGNLDVADSTRFLLGIVRGFKQGPEELHSTFDRINQAQNKFGVGIRDTSAGVAKAAGAWHAAGGDVNTLTAAIVAGSAKTGRSGEQLGTAFGRMAEIIKRSTSKNKEALKEFGIDASQPIDDILHKAAGLVRSGKVQGPRINQLATALTTPQLAPYITPILQDPAFLKRVEDTLAHSKGSAARELHQTLKSAREELSKIGTNLQTLGAEFVRAGGAAPFAVMLKALNLALSTATDLLQVFNELPGPIKTVAVSALEIAGVMKLLGRFGIGPGSLSGLLGGGPGALQRRAGTRAVELAQGAASVEADNLARARMNQAIALRIGDLEAARVADESATLAARRLAAAELELADAKQRRAQLDVAGVGADEALIVAERELAAAMTARAAVQGAATAADLLPAGARGARGLPTGYPIASRELTVAEREAIAARAATRPSIGQRLGGLLGPERNLSTRVGGGLAGATGKATSALGRAEASIARFAVAGGAMLGPLDLAIVAFLTLPPALDAIKNAIRKAQEAADRASQEPQSRAEREARAKGHKPGDRPLDYLPGVQDYLANTYGIGNTGAVEERDKETARLQIEAIDKLFRERYLGITRGRKAARNFLFPPRPANDPFAPLGPVGPVGAPVPTLGPDGKVDPLGGLRRPDKIRISGLSTAEIRHNAAAAVSEFKRGIISRSEAMRLVDASIRDIKVSSSSQPKKALAKIDLQALRDSLGPGRGRSLKDILNALSDKEFEKRMQQDAQAIQTLGLRPGRVRDVLKGYQTALARVKKHPTAGNVERFASSQQAVQAEAQRIDQNLQDDLKFATTAAEREAAYRKALNDIAKLPRSREKHLAKQQTLVSRFDDRFQTAQLHEQLRSASIADPLDRARADLANTNADIARMRDAIRQGLKSWKDLAPLLIQRKQNAEQVRQAADAEFQASQEAAAASFALAVHGAPGAIAQHDVAQAEQSYRRALSRGDRTAIKQAFARLQQTKLALWQYAHDEAAAMIQANQAYAEAGIDPANIVALANLHVRTARKDIRKNRANTPSGRREQDARLRAALAERLRAGQQTAYDDLSFAHNMGRITDSAYAEQLRALAKTIKHNKGLRRQLLLEAHNIEKAAKDGGDLDLNLGNIKLPTVYEIRRAMKGHAGPTQRQVQMTQNNRIDVTVTSDVDADAFFKQLDDYTGSGLQAAGRAQGAI